jgi:hypothetical protein
MLVLSRKRDEELVIAEGEIVIRIIEIRGCAADTLDAGTELIAEWAIQHADAVIQQLEQTP